MENKVASRTWLNMALPAVIFVLSLVLNLIGIKWSLPSSERSAFYPTDTARWFTAPKPTRLYYTAPFEPYHPDESFLLDAMTNMNPARLDFNPHFFSYPSLQIYLTAGAMKAADVAGLVKVVNSRDFYIANPDQMGRIYLIGRLLAALMSSLGVVCLYFTGKSLFSMGTGLFSALVLATMPLWVRDSHFMLVNVPGTSWMIGSAMLAALALKRESNRWLLLGSAVLAGLAFSTKYPAGAVILLPLFVWLKQRKPLRLAILMGVAFLGSFIITSPYIFLSLPEVVQDLQFEGSTKINTGHMSLGQFFAMLVVSQGFIGLLVSLLGMVLLARRWRSVEAQFVFLWLLAGCLQTLSSRLDFARYFIQAVPPLAIFAGLSLNAIREKIAALLTQTTIPASSTASTTPSVASSLAAWTVSLLLIVPAFGYSLNIDQILSRSDIRTQAAGWIDTHLMPGSSLGVVDHMYFDYPPINAEKYKIVDLNKLNGNELPAALVIPSVSRDLWTMPPSRPPKDYTVVNFSQHPSKIWIWPVSQSPADWNITFLDVNIYLKPNP